jgi:hypothetical protein
LSRVFRYFQLDESREAALRSSVSAKAVIEAEE